MICIECLRERQPLRLAAGSMICQANARSRAYGLCQPSAGLLLALLSQHVSSHGHLRCFMCLQVHMCHLCGCSGINKSSHQYLATTRQVTLVRCTWELHLPDSDSLLTEYRRGRAMLFVLPSCFGDILEQACNKATLSPASKQNQAQLETAARSALVAGSLSLQAIKPHVALQTTVAKATPTCMHASADYRIQTPTLCFLYLHVLGRARGGACSSRLKSCMSVSSSMLFCQL